ncbi:MAG TPA: WbqC family protein [Chitinophagales bacterium]|nr:WbqC family protein [Chitinophagales bacterium]
MSENTSKILLTEAHYLPPTAWMKLTKDYPVICFDTSAHFIKASYRNRCHILSANGILPLSVPLVHGREQRNTLGNVKISYEMAWQKNHWMTLTSAYRRSAYYEYFEDMFAPLYHTHYVTLMEFNLAALTIVFKILGLKPEIRFTNSYIEPNTAGYADFRNMITPKNNTPLNYTFQPYNQVFSDRFPFMENLSIIDMIFNKGKFDLTEI